MTTSKLCFRGAALARALAKRLEKYNETLTKWRFFWDLGPGDPCSNDLKACTNDGWSASIVFRGNGHIGILVGSNWLRWKVFWSTHSGIDCRYAHTSLVCSWDCAYLSQLLLGGCHSLDLCLLSWLWCVPQIALLGFVWFHLVGWFCPLSHWRRFNQKNYLEMVTRQLALSLHDLSVTAQCITNI